jgi:hypothetical protein
MNPFSFSFLQWHNLILLRELTKNPNVENTVFIKLIYIVINSTDIVEMKMKRMKNKIVFKNNKNRDFASLEKFFKQNNSTLIK